MHCLPTLRRINAEWPYPLTPKDRREAAVRQLERRTGIVIDRSDPMLRAIAAGEMFLRALLGGGAKSDEHEANAQREFNRAICRILEDEAELIRTQETGCGSFEKTVTTETGERVTWRFSLATGHGASSWEWRYREWFHMPLPTWIRRRSPAHIWELCELAIDYDRLLPPRNPLPPRGASVD